MFGPHVGTHLVHDDGYTVDEAIIFLNFWFFHTEILNYSVII